jgi:hypothetical protein
MHHKKEALIPDSTIDTMSAFKDTVTKSDSFSESSSDESPSDESLISAEVNEENEMNTTQKEQVTEVQEMAKRETNNMRFWKVLVCITILATATTVSSGTWIFLRSEEDDSFKDSYASFANTIRNSVRVHKRDLYSTMRSCSDSITGAAIATNTEFPFVTVPTFEIFGRPVRQQSGAELIVFTPKVEADELIRWEEYAITKEGWYEDSKQLAAASTESTSVLSDYVAGNISDFVYDASVDVDASGDLNPTPSENPPYYPMWQLSPPPFTPFALKADFKTLFDFGDYLKTVDIVKEGVFGQAFDERTDLGESVLNQADHRAFHAQFVTSNVESSAFERPHAFFYQPVFRQAYNDSSKIVGTVNALVPIDRYFANLLPEGVKGITGVLQNTCGRLYTYYLDGNKVSCSQLENERGRIPKTHFLSNHFYRRFLLERATCTTNDTTT